MSEEPNGPYIGNLTPGDLWNELLGLDDEFIESLIWIKDFNVRTEEEKKDFILNRKHEIDEVIQTINNAAHDRPLIVKALQDMGYIIL